MKIDRNGLVDMELVIGLAVRRSLSYNDYHFPLTDGSLHAGFVV